MMKKKITRNALTGYYFVLPTVAIFCIFLIFPMVNAFRLSLFHWDLLGVQKFIGLQNFTRLFSDFQFLNAWKRTIYFTFISVVFLIFFSFIFALMLDSRKLKAKNLFQAMYFLPVILVTPAVGVVWQLMFQSRGILNAAIFLPLFGTAVRWLESTQVAFYSIIIVQIWISVGYYMVMFIAGLQGIPNEYYESALIDGASWLRRMFSITIPLLKPIFTLATVTCIIFVFGQFPIPYVITQGGPDYATELLTLFIYRQGFRYMQAGYASAASIFYFLTMLIFSVIQIKAFKSKA